jgi:hypothetical protein
MMTISPHKSLFAITLLAVLAGAANLAGTFSVRGLQADVNERQKYIQDTVPLETLNRDIAQALAQLSVKNQDNDLRKLLEAHGISFAVAPAKAP